MEKYTDILGDLLPLDPIERSCMRFLMRYPDKQVMDAAELRTFLQDAMGVHAAVKMDMNDILTEDTLIPDGYNVMVLKHLRYLPGYFHSHDFFEVNCVLSGTCTYRTTGKNVMIQAGDIVVFPPHADHLIDVRSDDCILITVLIRASTFDRYYFSLLRGYDALRDFWMQALYGQRAVDYLLFHCGDKAEIRKYVLDLFRESSRPSKYQSQMLDALFHVFLIALMQNHEQDLVIANPERKKDSRDFLTIMDFIGREYNILTLSGLASEFHHSERQIMRMLREYTGMGFGDLMRDIKLKKAAALLESSNTPILTIVEAVGYSDRKHFYNMFKRMYGCTPIEYRVEMTKKTAGS